MKDVLTPFQARSRSFSLCRCRPSSPSRVRILLEEQGCGRAWNEREEQDVLPGDRARSQDSLGSLHLCRSADDGFQVSRLALTMEGRAHLADLAAFSRMAVKTVCIHCNVFARCSISYTVYPTYLQQAKAFSRTASSKATLVSLLLARLS